MYAGRTRNGFTPSSRDRLFKRFPSLAAEKCIEHAVELEARTLYEAVGLAIDRFRRCEHVRYEPKGLHESMVESREPGTPYRLTRNMFDAWLCRPGGSPADVALKTKLKGILGDVA